MLSLQELVALAKFFSNRILKEYINSIIFSHLEDDLHEKSGHTKRNPELTPVTIVDILGRPSIRYKRLFKELSKRLSGIDQNKVREIHQKLEHLHDNKFDKIFDFRGFTDRLMSIINTIGSKKYQYLNDLVDDLIKEFDNIYRSNPASLRDKLNEVKTRLQKKYSIAEQRLPDDIRRYHIKKEDGTSYDLGFAFNVNDILKRFYVRGKEIHTTSGIIDGTVNISSIYKRYGVTHYFRNELQELKRLFDEYELQDRFSQVIDHIVLSTTSLGRLTSLRNIQELYEIYKQDFGKTLFRKLSEEYLDVYDLGLFGDEMMLLSRSIYGDVFQELKSIDAELSTVLYYLYTTGKLHFSTHTITDKRLSAYGFYSPHKDVIVVNLDYLIHKLQNEDNNIKRFMYHNVFVHELIHYLAEHSKTVHNIDLHRVGTLLLTNRDVLQDKLRSDDLEFIVYNKHQPTLDQEIRATRLLLQSLLDGLDQLEQDRNVQLLKDKIKQRLRPGTLTTLQEFISDLFVEIVAESMTYKYLEQFYPQNIENLYKMVFDKRLVNQYYNLFRYNITPSLNEYQILDQYLTQILNKNKEIMKAIVYFHSKSS